MRGAPAATTINYNSTMDHVVAQLYHCSGSAVEVTKLNKWFAEMIQSTEDRPALNQRRACEEKWLSCLLPAPASTSPSEAYVVRLLLKQISLCAETEEDERAHSDFSFRGILLLVLAILNLIGLSGGLLLYSYRSSCQLRLRQNGER